MNDVLLKIAAGIVSKSSATHPADSVLRDELRKQRGLSRDDGWEISNAVFTYFRWFGWLNPKDPLSKNLSLAQELAQRFSREPQSFSDAELVAKSVPNWIREQVEISPALARTLQNPPTLWLRTKRGLRDEVEEKLRHCSAPESRALPDTLEFKGAIDLFRTPEFHEGLFELQDISSQAVSVICDPKPGQTWWDACAGEGGKTLHFSELMQNKGLIWASDRAEWRLKKLKQRAARAKAFNYRVAVWNGSEKLPTKTKFDGVLVDAPCSGVGTWQRNPHARWTATLNDVLELSALQKQLLRHAAAAVKPGGKLIYSVCTLTRAETVEVAANFSKEFPDFQPVALSNPLEPRASEKSEIWLWPQQSRGNGMFIAAWQKSGANKS
jgi:16S rRNA (cytosine967-C5)-methyltransferase